MVTLRYSLTAEDFANYSVYVHLDAPGKKKSRFNRLMVVLVVMLVVFGINMYGTIASGNFGLAEIIPVVIILAFYFTITTTSLKQRVKKAAMTFAANPQNASFFQMTDYTFSETGVAIKDDLKDTKLQWRAFVKKQETATYIYLFINSTSAYILPKRMFKSEVQQEELNRLFGQYISFDAEVGHLIN